MSTKVDKTRFNRYLDENLDELWKISKEIHSAPELAYQEYKACEIQCSYLQSKGFEITKAAGGVETAYVARFGKGRPIIAVFSEYDALPNLGHACGHNLIAASALGAGIVAKKYLENTNTEGTLLVVGTPAEEGGGGKIKLLEAGVLGEIDAVIMQHPTSAKTRLAGECMSSVSLRLEFVGKSAQAGSHPENGINALSSATLFVVASGLLRQQLKTNTRISEYIVNGGEAVNIIPSNAVVQSRIMSFNANDLQITVDKIRSAAEGCAKAIGCSIKIEETKGYLGRLPNKTLSDVCRNELLDLNEPVMDGMPFDYGGEDLGNVSRVIPICNPYVTIFPDYKISGHTPQFRELAGSEAGKHNIDVASKAMGNTVIDLFVEPKLIDTAKEEMTARLESEKQHE